MSDRIHCEPPIGPKDALAGWIVVAALFVSLAGATLTGISGPIGDSPHAVAAAAIQDATG